MHWLTLICRFINVCLRVRINLGEISDSTRQWSIHVANIEFDVFVLRLIFVSGSLATNNSGPVRRDASAGSCRIVVPAQTWVIATICANTKRFTAEVACAII